MCGCWLLRDNNLRLSSTELSSALPDNIPEGSLLDEVDICSSLPPEVEQEGPVADVAAHDNQGDMESHVPGGNRMMDCLLCEGLGTADVSFTYNSFSFHSVPVA